MSKSSLQGYSGVSSCFQPKVSNSFRTKNVFLSQLWASCYQVLWAYGMRMQQSGDGYSCKKKNPTRWESLILFSPSFRFMARLLIKLNGMKKLLQCSLGMSHAAKPKPEGHLQSEGKSLLLLQSSHKLLTWNSVKRKKKRKIICRWPYLCIVYHRKQKLLAEVSQTLSGCDFFWVTG